MLQVPKDIPAYRAMEFAVQSIHCTNMLIVLQSDLQEVAPRKLSSQREEGLIASVECILTLTAAEYITPSSVIDIL